MEGGRASWEGCSEFGNRIDQIKKELKEKYTPGMVNEKNWIKRVILKVKLQLEIRKNIKKLSSIKNLHLVRI